MKILVCDDEPGIRRTLAQILEDEGYTVDAVGLGQEALSTPVLRTATDPTPFSTSGCRTSTAPLCWLRDNTDVPVIMISGHRTVETAVAAVKRGADDFLRAARPGTRPPDFRGSRGAAAARERDDLKREPQTLYAREAEEMLFAEAPRSAARADIAKADPDAVS
jgi:DNA-binding NtrC family response regulator